jgi:tetratricopeptide (TPR) repeat protein
LHEAIADYTRALELKPNDFLSLSGRGQVLAEDGDGARAMVDLDRALHLIRSGDSTDPASAAWRSAIEAFARNGRALALSSIGDSTGAMKEFDRSIALCPDNAWVYHNRAQVYELLGDTTRVRADYRQSISKAQPALSLKRKEHAQARLLALSTYP